MSSGPVRQLTKDKADDCFNRLERLSDDSTRPVDAQQQRLAVHASHSEGRWHKRLIDCSQTDWSSATTAHDEDKQTDTEKKKMCDVKNADQSKAEQHSHAEPSEQSSRAIHSAACPAQTHNLNLHKLTASDCHEIRHFQPF